MYRLLFAVLLAVGLIGCSSGDGKASKPVQQAPAQSVVAASAATPPISAWQADLAKRHAELAVKMIAQAEKDLKTVIDTADFEGLNKYITAPFARQLRFWREQRTDLNNPQAEKFSTCHEALFEFQFYSMTYGKPDGIDTRKERSQRKADYLKNLSACRKAIGK